MPRAGGREVLQVEGVSGRVGTAVGLRNTCLGCQLLRRFCPHLVLWMGTSRCRRGDHPRSPSRACPPQGCRAWAQGRLAPCSPRGRLGQPHNSSSNLLSTYCVPQHRAWQGGGWAAQVAAGLSCMSPRDGWSVDGGQAQCEDRVPERGVARLFSCLPPARPSGIPSWRVGAGTGRPWKTPPGALGRTGKRPGLGTERC